MKDADVQEEPTTDAPKMDADCRKYLHRNDSTYIEGPSIGLCSVGKILCDDSRDMIHFVHSSLLLCNNRQECASYRSFRDSLLVYDVLVSGFLEKFHPLETGDISNAAHVFWPSGKSFSFTFGRSSSFSF